MPSDLKSDIKTLYNLIRPHRGHNHQQRLEEFYHSQANDYDRFRERLLSNRKELYQALPIRPGERLLDVGGGTGRNLEFLGDMIHQLESATILDLCSPLLAVAKQRITEHRWDRVQAIQADATSWTAQHNFEHATCSYSLSMMPDWYRVIDHTISQLNPGGHLGVVDFYVSRKHPRQGMVKHSYLRRQFWPWWFGHDNVHLRPDLLPYLSDKLEVVELTETLASVPYFPVKVPVFRFIGKKR